MIEKKDIQALPFVDGVPDPTARPDQARIDWIKNGECSSGAETRTGNEGSLNRSGVSVQENVVEVQANVEIVKKSLDETIDLVNEHEKILGQSDGLDLIQTVQKHSEEIETLNFAVAQNADRFDELAEKVDTNTSEIGVVPSHDTADRSVREELEWQKQEMGSYPGFDYNGKPDVDSRGTGMKNRIINNSMAISDHNARINELESDWASSDIGSLTREVQAIRSEVGPAKDKVPGHHIYDRLKKVENVSQAGQTDITALNQHTGIATFPRPEAVTLIDLVDIKTQEINKLVEDLAVTNGRILIVETEIGDSDIPDTIKYNQKVTMKDVSDLYGIVGKSNSEGLRYSVAILETEIGSDAVPGTVKNRILLTEQGIRDLNIQMDAIDDILGISSPGTGSFNDRVTELELQMNGDENADTDFEKTGVYPYAFELYNKKPVGDVLDDEIYVRTKDAWIKLGSKSIDLIDSAKLKVDGKDFISKTPLGVTLGSDEIISIAAPVDNLKVVDDVKIHINEDEYQLVSSVSNGENGNTISFGDSNAITDIIGQTVLINGDDVLTKALKDVPDDGKVYVRTHDSWIITEEPVPFTHIVTQDGKDVFVSNGSLIFGSDEKDTIIKGVKEIHTKDLVITDETGANVISNLEDRVQFEKPLYVGTHKVTTAQDDAPVDNNYYARYKGTWAKIDPSGGGTGGGIEDAPNDDKSYVRSGQDWKELGTTPVILADDVSMQWEINAGQFTGLKYTKATNKLALGGSGAKVEIVGDVSRLSLDSKASIVQTLEGSSVSVLASDSDKNLLIGDKDVNKSVILRSVDDAQVQTSKGQFKLWHSGDDAVQDGQMYGRKDGKWTVFKINRTQDVVLNLNYAFKVADSKDKLLTVATAGLDNIIELGESTSLMNIRSTLRSINLDDKVKLTATDGADKINLIGKDGDKITIGSAVKKIQIEGSELQFNGSRVITEADDAPADNFKYVRTNNKWDKAFGYGEDAPSSVGAKEGDVYFQYM